MRFDIAKSLNGERITYIARDTNGIVRLRASSEEELIEMIKNYQPIPSSKPAPIDDRTQFKASQPEPELETLEPIVLEEPILVSNSENPENGAREIAKLLVTNPAPEIQPEPEVKKEFLQNTLQEKVEDKKKKTGGSSFWDKLK